MADNNIYGEKCAKVDMDEYYETNHQERNLAIIFNQKDFFPETGYTAPRDGTDKDCDDLERVLNDLSFNVEVYNSETYERIREILKEAARMDHSNKSCIIVTIMTHGTNENIYAKNKAFPRKEIWSEFTADKCPTLKGKPKLFFIQACSGNQIDMGTTLQQFDGFECTTKWNFVKNPDFLIVQSSAPGFKSARHLNKGTIFIQTLCNKLKSLGSCKDILTIVTYVFQGVAMGFMGKQIPYFTSSFDSASM